MRSVYPGLASEMVVGCYKMTAIEEETAPDRADRAPDADEANGAAPGRDRKGGGKATPPKERLAQISDGWGHTCGVRADGTVACRGNDASGESTPPEGIFTQVAAGWGHTCGITSDAALACRGCYAR